MNEVVPRCIEVWLDKCSRWQQHNQEKVGQRLVFTGNGSYCYKNVGTDGNPFQNSKTYHHRIWADVGHLVDLLYQTSDAVTFSIKFGRI